MKISALKENDNHEVRVSLSPESIKLFKRFDLDILVEEGAGVNSGFLDQQYKDFGAKIVTRDECLDSDICLCVKIPSIDDLESSELAKLAPPIPSLPVVLPTYKTGKSSCSSFASKLTNKSKVSSKTSLAL